MKKTYINPSTEVIKIATQRMLADSLQTNEAPITKSSDIGARRGWFDDSDDE